MKVPTCKNLSSHSCKTNGDAPESAPTKPKQTLQRTVPYHRDTDAKPCFSRPLLRIPRRPNAETTPQHNSYHNNCHKNTMGCAGIRADQTKANTPTNPHIAHKSPSNALLFSATASPPAHAKATDHSTTQSKLPFIPRRNIKQAISKLHLLNHVAANTICSLSALFSHHHHCRSTSRPQ
jgi:hypothetical protein